MQTITAIFGSILMFIGMINRGIKTCDNVMQMAEETSGLALNEMQRNNENALKELQHRLDKEEAERNLNKD